MNFHKLKGEDAIIYAPTGHLVDSSLVLKPGLFKLENGGGLIFSPKFIPITNGDGLIKFTSGVMKNMLDKIGVFFSDDVKNKYKKLEITHKMGIILHGPPGTGKTALCKLLMLQEVENHQAICLDCTSMSLDAMLYTIGIIRKQQSTPIIIFWDELEYVAEHGNLLTFLDGTYSYDNLIFIGCTNFPGMIPKRIIDRKSRIKHVFEIKSLESAVYKEYILKKLPEIKKEELEKYVWKAAEADLTIDQLKNSIIDYYVDEMSIEKSIAEAKKIIDSPEL